MTEENIKFVSKLNRDTKEGNLNWNNSGSLANIILPSNERLLGICYFTSLFGKHIRIYRYSYRYFFDEDAYETVEDVRLEFFEMLTGLTIWTFPRNNLINDLYETVSFRASDIQNVFNEYLKGEISDDSNEEF